tara:strand:- start:671 stop:1021 length:351 start_codon:yes stop_codon:yes gene_type:complete
MAEYNNIITLEGVTRTEITGEELTKLEANRTAFANKSGERKLEVIKQLRLEKLIETDYLANSDVTMPDNIKTWRQSLRDIPQDYTTEEQYDLLLARETDKTKTNFGQLTHTVWEKP